MSLGATGIYVLLFMINVLGSVAYALYGDPKNHPEWVGLYVALAMLCMICCMLWRWKKGTSKVIYQV